MKSQLRVSWIIELAACSVLLLAPNRVQAQQPPPPTCDATPFLDAGGWTGTVTIIGTGLGTYNDAFGRTFSYEIHQSISLTPTFAPGTLSPEQWSGPENATVSVNDTYTEVTDDPQAGTITTTDTYFGSGTSAMGGLGTGAAFQINSVPLSCGYAFGADSTFAPGTLTSTTVDRFGTTTSSSTGKIPWGAPSIPILLDPPASLQQVLPFPSSGTTLRGNTEFDFFPQDVPSGFDTNQVIVHWVITWSFTPTTEPLDLIVTIPNYLSWRPVAGRDENSTVVNFQPPNFPPNILQITAQVVFKDTQQPAPFGPEKISFSLVDVSREPGVAMNWPPQDQLITPVPPDMSFKALDGKLGGFNDQFSFPDADGTEADFSPQDPSSANSATTIYLISYDWGGRATLNVTATAAGQSLQGHLWLPPNETDILLPNRQPGAWVADGWKAAHGVTALDDGDDAENNPLGDGKTGDGLSLWEEYRGFYMGCSANNSPPKPESDPNAFCRHAEGDPRTKDLFVVNRIGANAIGGIGLFQFGSGLNVHYRGLKLSEVGPKGTPLYRVINFNHAAAPHNVDQHAIVLDWGAAADSGKSFTVPTDDFTNCPANAVHGCAMLPKHADHIEINQDLRGAAYQTSTGSSYSELTVTVAHELAHAVDVYHHGDAVDHEELWSADPTTGEVFTQMLDPSGNPVGTRTPITVVEEDQLGSVTAGLTGFNLGLFDFDKNGNPLITPPKHFTVGNRICNGAVFTGGESSGDVLDFMRYDDTLAYIPASKLPSDVRVYVNDGDSGSGVDLTDHPGGTGANAPNRKPLPRFGDADTSHQRGNDRSQVDVNDNNTEIIRGEFSCPASAPQ